MYLPRLVDARCALLASVLAVAFVLGASAFAAPGGNGNPRPTPAPGDHEPEIKFKLEKPDDWDDELDGEWEPVYLEPETQSAEPIYVLQLALEHEARLAKMQASGIWACSQMRFNMWMHLLRMAPEQREHVISRFFLGDDMRKRLVFPERDEIPKEWLEAWEAWDAVKFEVYDDEAQ